MVRTPAQDTHLSRWHVYRSAYSAAALVAVALIWGASYVVVKNVLEVVPPFAYLTLRYLIAIPVVALLCARSITRWATRSTSRQALLVNIYPGLWLTAAFLLQAYGLQDTTPGKAVLLTSLVFVFVPVIERLSGEAVKYRQLGSVVILAFVGVWLIALPVDARWVSADILIVLCAVAYSMQIWLTGRARATSETSAVFLIQGSIVLLVSGIGWLWNFNSWEIELSRQLLVQIGFIGLVATAGCYLAQFAAQRYVKPRYVGIILALEPVSGLALAYLLGYEVLTWTMASGSLLILAAVVLAILQSNRNPELNS